MNLKRYPFVLMILDGWGCRSEHDNNAIYAAKKPIWDHLWKTYPHGELAASGLAVGLPKGQMGNSEVGHLNIGTGRVICQDSNRIEKAIDDGSFFENEIFQAAIKKVLASNKTLHILGLLSPGGVHSHENHIHALIELAHRQQVKKIAVHTFLDGRDMPPKSAMSSIIRLENKFKQLGVGVIASLMGRYYAMDRDNRWDRIEKAYQCLTEGKTNYHANTAEKALELAYARNETDEFVSPTCIHAVNKSPLTIEDDDVVVFMNYRADRVRQLTRAFVETDFKGFHRNRKIELADFVTLTEYAKELKTSIAFLPQRPINGLGEVISQHGLSQLRLAETEKYAHVTFFFNGGIEKPFPGEERLLIPSPKVSTYDQRPQMSAVEITAHLIEAIKSEKYSLIVCNFANPDMVGHTGNFDAAVKAIETIDVCLGRIVEVLKNVDGEVIIAADHGNAECMYNHAYKQRHTAHTNNPVPFIYVGRKAEVIRNDAALSDIAPTILELLNFKKPKEMTGKTFLKLV